MRWAAFLLARAKAEDRKFLAASSSPASTASGIITIPAASARPGMGPWLISIRRAWYPWFLNSAFKDSAMPELSLVR